VASASNTQPNGGVAVQDGVGDELRDTELRALHQVVAPELEAHRGDPLARSGDGRRRGLQGECFFVGWHVVGPRVVRQTGKASRWRDGVMLTPRLPLPRSWQTRGATSFVPDPCGPWGM